MPHLTLSTYFRITRASAMYDLIVVVPFVTPWTFALLHPQLSALNVWLGGAPLAPFASVHILFSCLMGSLVMLWASMRLRAPSLTLGRYDGTGRFLFAGWMGWALAQGGLPLVWLFLVPELLWGAVQWWPVGVSHIERRRQGAGLTLVRAS